jgi:uncharacterized protein (TIGR03663 family)
MKQISAKPRKAESNLRAAEPSLAQRITAPRDAWWWSGLSIVIAAALLRLLFLTEKPLHHDEGVNGVFLATLFRTGYYHYDPANYHGPILYYLTVIPTAINSLFHWGHGLSTFGIRLVTAVFGAGVVWLVLGLRRWLGDAGSLAAAVFAAFSPGFVYFSRYFIHEILFVFFTLGIIVAWLWHGETGKQRYLMLASASAALLFATKETWIITVAVWLIALPCTLIWLRLLKLPEQRPPRARRAASNRAAEPGKPEGSKPFVSAALLFVAIAVVLYSSFFTNPKGILDSLLTFTYWTKTGQHGIYNREWSTYLKWLGQEEMPILILGAVGLLVALVRARSRLLVSCAFWTLGIFAAYSLVPYKTPWLALSLILPLALMAGHLINEMYRPGLRALTIVVAAIAAAAALYQAIDISFVHYDDNTDAYPYVYAHTTRDFLSLINEIDSIAARNPVRKDIGITVVSPEHWPMPWYLREYTHVGYWGHLVPTSEPIVIALKSQSYELEQQLGGGYRQFSTHDLRPGNTLVMYVKKDLP